MKRCPGKPLPVRPAVLLPMCRQCPLQDADAVRSPPAHHDGTRWICAERSQAASKQG